MDRRQKTKAEDFGLKDERRLCLLSFVLCPLLVALAAPEPTAQIGVVAQRYPWNGVVDVTCKVANAPKDAPLVVCANGVEVVRVAATNGEQKVSFDASKIDALKNKKLKDVKITAKVEGEK